MQIKLVGLTLCRNEAWAIGATVRAALRWLDEAVIFNHASTDGTGEVLAELRHEFQDRVHVIVENDPTFKEMNFRQRTLDKARAVGGSHMAIVDSDEMLTENLVPTIRGHIEALAPGEVMQPPWIMLWRSLNKFRDDGSIWSNSWVSWAFRDAPGLHWTTRNIGGAKEYCLHHRHPHSSTVAPRTIDRGQGGVLHFQHASWRRLLAKQAAYKMQEQVRWPEFGIEAIDARYNPTVDETGIHLSPLPAAWRPPELAAVEIDAEPWQEVQCRKYLAEHGAAKFAGLNLFGVV